MHCLFLFFISLAFKLLLAFFFFTEFVMKNGNYVKKIVNFIFFLFSALQNWLFRFKAFFNLLYFLVKENRIFSKADGWSFSWHVNCINKETKKKNKYNELFLFSIHPKSKKIVFRTFEMLLSIFFLLLRLWEIFCAVDIFQFFNTIKWEMQSSEMTSCVCWGC